ncbi:Signal transduction histidine kinase [uncultured Desulfobacterium sp.]|uniref:histidine kinase n=1 Tax=uncultured Desulfobacterium sp. TaxID=201089 RepID=A0A445MVE5_9BACT|nr:Signal transduction histidine kinase [uncultured Desulfobacterium sp.]
MNDQARTNQELLREISLLKQKIKEMEKSESERKKTEEALRESEQKIRALFDQTFQFIGMLTPDGTLIEANRTAMKFAGIHESECIGLPFWNTPWWTHSAEMQNRLREAFKSALKGEVARLEVTHPAADGTIHYVDFSLKPVMDEFGKIKFLIPEGRDINERKEMEEALRESEERFRCLSAAAFDAVIIHENGVLLSANEQYYEMFGYEPEELLGKQALPLTVAPEALEAMRKEITSGGLGPYESIGQKKDETKFPIEIRVRQLQYKGRDVRVAVIMNITERKRAEEACRQAEEEKQRLEERLHRAEKMEALGTLAGGVAHDLNNVLGVVVGYTELLLMNADKSTPIASQLMKIMKGGQKAAVIVDDLLTLARRGVSRRQIINLNKIITDTQLSPEFEKLQFYHPYIQIKIDLEPELLNIYGSSVHLSKTLFNLASNAAEAMPEQGILSIKTANCYLDRPIQGYDEVREGDYVVLSVSDTGEGIAAEDLKRIFEPFYTKKVMGRSGTGLGLAVVWGTVKDHQGYINIQSEQGKGSTFSLYFPVTRQEVSPETLPIAISEYAGKGESILVVDDIQEQRDLAASMLRALNYNVSSVSSGEEAIAYLREHHVDLMVLDMVMDPGMDGLDTYRSVLEICSKQKAIIVSGFSESDRVHNAQALGAGAYVKKPYVIEKLGLAVREELDRK